MADIEKPYFEVGAPSVVTAGYYATTHDFNSPFDISPGIVVNKGTQYPIVPAYGNYKITPNPSSVDIYPERQPTLTTVQNDFASGFNTSFCEGWGRSYCWTSGSTLSCTIDGGSFSASGASCCHAVMRTIGGLVPTSTLCNYPPTTEMGVLVDSTRAKINFKHGPLSTSHLGLYYLNDRPKLFLFPLLDGVSIEQNSAYITNMPSFASYAVQSEINTFAQVVGFEKNGSRYKITCDLPPLNNIAINAFIYKDPSNSYYISQTSDPFNAFMIREEQANLLNKLKASKNKNRRFTVDMPGINPDAPGGTINIGSLVSFSSQQKSLNYFLTNTIEDFTETLVSLGGTEPKLYSNMLDIFYVECQGDGYTHKFFIMTPKT